MATLTAIEQLPLQEILRCLAAQPDATSFSVGDWTFRIEDAAERRVSVQRRETLLATLGLLGQVVGVCGGIAAGKTTLTRLIAGKFPGQVLSSEEEVDSTLLEMYINESSEYATHFQTVMLSEASSRERLIASGLGDNMLSLVERPYEENVVFARANTVAGNMSLRYYQTWYAAYLRRVERLSKVSKHLVFLFVSAEERARRQAIRSRRGEENYRSDYFVLLDDCYFEFVLQMAAEKRMLVIDWHCEAQSDLLLESLQRFKRLPQVTLHTSGATDIAPLTGYLSCPELGIARTATGRSPTLRKQLQEQVYRALASDSCPQLTITLEK
jgi:deoxyadenosine/deoxycytidine kinase